MAHETLVCQEQISGDTLSALRDEALPESEAVRLRAHIPTCAACQSRLADFDKLAGALRAQRELDPGDRVLAGVQARIAGRASGPRGGRLTWNLRGMTGGRRMWAGLAALAPVAAIILLFFYVFAGISHQPHIATTPTADGPTPTPTFFKQIVPTATPALVQVPAFTPSVPAARTWPGFKPAIDVTFKPSGTTEFIPNVFSSDLTTIGGIVLTFNNSTNQTHAQLAYYTISTGAVSKLSPTWNGFDGPWGGVSAMDSRYIIYGFNNQPGATCGVCNNTLWSLDRATGKTWQFNSGLGGDLLDYTSADHVVFASVTGQVWVADLAAHTVKIALPIGSQPYTASTQPAADERLLGFQWPYLIYAETPATTPSAQQPATRLNVLNLGTGVSTPIHATMSDPNGNPLAGSYGLNAALVGKTLYVNSSTGLDGVDAHGNPVNVNYGTLYRLDDFTSGDKFIAVAVWPYTSSTIDSPTMATRHLIALGSGYIWDNAELRLVSTPLTNENEQLIVNVQLLGSDIVSVDQLSPNTPFQTYHARAYNTSGFPVPPGW